MSCMSIWINAGARSPCSPHNVPASRILATRLIVISFSCVVDASRVADNRTDGVDRPLIEGSIPPILLGAHLGECVFNIRSAIGTAS